MPTLMAENFCNTVEIYFRTKCNLLLVFSYHGNIFLGQKNIYCSGCFMCTDIFENRNYHRKYCSGCFYVQPYFRK